MYTISSAMAWVSSSRCSRSLVPGDEEEWIKEIRESLAGDDAVDMAASICKVPEGVRESRPLAYTPQAVALGPYHHWKPELYEMEKYKLRAARRVQQRLPSRRLDHVKEHFRKLVPEIRACYVGHLDFCDDTLSWMMVIDTCFLLDFLLMHETTNEERAPPLCMSCLYGIPGKMSTNIDVLRDVLMLENQLPLFLLQILDAEAHQLTAAAISNSNADSSSLEDVLTTFMKDLTPFRSVAVFPRIDITTAPRAHLLDVLCHMLLPTSPSPAAIKESPIEYVRATTSAKEAPPRSSHFRQLLESTYNALSILPVTFMATVTLAVTLPLNLLRLLFPSWSSNVEERIRRKILDDEEGKPPMVEEILIPSVTKLVGAGVQFRATDGGLSTIAFDPGTATFSLPSVTVDGTTEEVLRNLVAYESSSTCGPELVLARYTELMNGIIDTEEDVELLRRSGVVTNRMRSDAEAAEMWNGMSKSMRMTRVGFLDKVIADVNAYYNGRWKVRAKRALTKYVYGPWRLLALVATLLMLLASTLQAVCYLYPCGGLVRVAVPVMGGGMPSMPMD